MIYNVVSATGPGLLSIVIAPQDGFPVGDDEFTEGQSVGTYSISWQVQTTPSESEDWSAGLYQVQVAVCEGDCTNSHPWGGVYAQANTQFTIVNSTSIAN